MKICDGSPTAPTLDLSVRASHNGINESRTMLHDSTFDDGVEVVLVDLLPVILGFKESCLGSGVDVHSTWMSLDTYS